MQLLGLFWAGRDAAERDASREGHSREAARPMAAGRSRTICRATRTRPACRCSRSPKPAASRRAIAAYKKGVAYLLSTQRPDGSWYVKSRAVKFQPFFDGGFPYGHDQWISSMATGWATAALATALP